MIAYIKNMQTFAAPRWLYCTEEGFGSKKLNR